MRLATLQRTSGWIPMFCMAVAIMLAMQTAVQAFALADDVGHHVAEAIADAAHDLDLERDNGERPIPADKFDHPHTDHHGIALMLDMTDAQYDPGRLHSAMPRPRRMRAGSEVYGIERPPKA